MNKYWTKTDTFPWGKHQGETLMSVIVGDVSYITWCIENVKGFVLENEAYEAYEKFAETPYLNS
jgi:hypothetical protein